MLGIPENDRSWIGQVVADLATFLDPFTKFEAETVDAAVADFSRYFEDLAKRRAVEPRDDLVTALGQAEADGHRLSQDELAANAALLIFAGHDTTTNALGNALIALADHPEQRDLIRSRPELWPNAVEELLRYATTAVSVVRQTSADITSQLVEQLGDYTVDHIEWRLCPNLRGPSNLKLTRQQATG